MLPLDQHLRRYCKEHSTCTLRQTLQGQAVSADVFPLLLFPRPRQRAPQPVCPLRTFLPPESQTLPSTEPSALAFSDIQFLRHVHVKMPCWKGNWQILSALGYGGTNLNQSFKNEPCIQYKIKYKPQSYIVFDHSGNLPCSKFECQCENLLGKSSLGSGGAIWNADTAHQSSDLNFKSRYKETLKTETKNKGEREWGGVKWNTLCNFFYRFSPRTGEEQIQKMLGSLIVTETTSYSTLKRF